MRTGQSSRRRFRRLRAWCACFACAVLTAEAPGQEGSVIKSTTRLVQVSLVAHDKSGQTVGDLSRDDFRLMDNGHPQTIAIFSKEIASPIRDNPDAAKKVNPLVVSNRTINAVERPVPVTVILFDALNMLTLDDFLFAKREIIRFLGTLKPGDPVAIYSMNGPKVRVIHDFTEDAASLAQAAQTLSQSGTINSPMVGHTFALSSSTDRVAELGKWAMEGSRKDEAALLRMTTEWTLTGLEEVARHLTGIPGRKNLIWISGSFPITIGLGAESFHQAGGARIDPDLFNFTERAHKVARLLSEAQTSVYPIDPAGVQTDRVYQAVTTRDEARANLGAQSAGHMITAGDKAEARVESMMLMAKDTGGLPFHNTNDLFGSIRRAMDDAQVAYTLGFYPPESAWDGKDHKLSVTVNRRGVEIRGRSSYLAGSPAAESAHERQEALRQAIDTPIEGTAIGIRVNVDSNPLDWYGHQLVVVIEGHDLQFREADGRFRAEADMVMVQQSEDGGIIKGEKDTFQYALSPESYQNALTSGLFQKRDVTVDPRTFRVRVVVRDAATGATGSVSIPVRQHSQPAKK